MNIQQSHYFSSENDILHGALFLPKNNIKNKGYIVCSPFAEEKKSAHRSLFELANHLSDKGFPVLLFDYAGCGDSHGEFKDSSLSQYMRDVNNAISFLKQETEVSEIGLIGLRLGAYLIMQNKVAPCEEYVLIEPVINPNKYFKQILRQKLMKELITDGQVSSKRSKLMESLDTHQSIDFDGYEISPEFYHDLKQYSSLEKELFVVNKPALFIHISHTRKTNREVGKLLVFMEQNKNIFYKQLKLEPFWSRIENPQYEPMIHEVINFCTQNNE